MNFLRFFQYFNFLIYINDYCNLKFIKILFNIINSDKN